LIVLKSAAGVPNSGALIVTGGGPGDICTLGALQTRAPFFVNVPPRLSIPTRSGD
jgi:hypothetical protein